MRVLERRICDNPDFKCFRGICLHCNSFEFKAIEDVEAMAVRQGCQLDFIAGYAYDFPYAKKVTEV